MAATDYIPKRLRKVAPILSYELANDLLHHLKCIYNGLPVRYDDFDGVMAGAILEELEIAITANPVNRLKYVERIRKEQQQFAA